MKDYRKGSSLLYAAIARIYDFMDRLLFPDEGTNPRNVLAKNIPRGARSILDFCAGTGSSALRIAAGSADRRVSGIDISRKMLGIAREKAAAAGLANAEFREMDATAVAYPDASFDVVTTSLSLHEMPAEIRDRVLSEMRRLVKADGRLMVVEWDRPDSGLRSAAFRIFPEAVEPRGIKDFLSMDWRAFLARRGFGLETTIRCPFTKVIVARPILPTAS